MFEPSFIDELMHGVLKEEHGIGDEAHLTASAEASFASDEDPFFEPKIFKSDSTVLANGRRDYEKITKRGVPIFTFGSEGSEDGQLSRPWGICCDRKGRILVSDRSNNRIQVFTPDGEFVSKFGTYGFRLGELNRPAGITVNLLNQIIVADKDNHRIQVFDEDGNFVFMFGNNGRQLTSFNYPWGVATNSLNHIAVSDTRNHRVQIFTMFGQFLRKCTFDTNLMGKHLYSPRGVCYLPNDQLIVTDFNGHRVAVLDLSKPQTECICYGAEGHRPGFFCRPQGIVMDNQNNVIVCDSRCNRIQVFSLDGMRISAVLTGKQPNNNQSGLSAAVNHYSRNNRQMFNHSTPQSTPTRSFFPIHHLHIPPLIHTPTRRHAPTAQPWRVGASIGDMFESFSPPFGSPSSGPLSPPPSYPTIGSKIYTPLRAPQPPPPRVGPYPPNTTPPLTPLNSQFAPQCELSPIGSSNSHLPYSGDYMVHSRTFMLPTVVSRASIGGGQPAYNGVRSLASISMNSSPPQGHLSLEEESAMDRPCDVCVGLDGRIYVVDFGNNCVRVF